MPQSVGREFVGDDAGPLHMELRLAHEELARVLAAGSSASAIEDAWDRIDGLREKIAELRGHDEAMIAGDESARDYDFDGRLHVDPVNISKAQVSEYFGREIPHFEDLGLDPKKMYRLLRDPAELEKGASTFNRVPLMSKHVVTTADDHKKDTVVGTTGSDARYEHPYLKNSIAIWPGHAIKDVERELKKELSSGYHYRADMTPGTYEGKPYDGVMRDIIGNHVAIVKAGRAGPDVVVGDSKPEPDEEIEMPALTAFEKEKAKADIRKLAVDELRKAFVKSKDGKITLAADAKIEDVSGLLDKISAHGAAPEAKDMAPALQPNSGIPPLNPGGPEASDEEEEDPNAPVKNFLKGKLSEDDMKACDGLWANLKGGKGKDALPFKGAAKPFGKDADPPTPPEGGPEKAPITKPAMDEAIKSAIEATRTQEREIRSALAAVRPIVGEITIAMDSASDVYKTALEMKGVKLAKDTHPSAFRAIFDNLPKKGERREAPVVALDAANPHSFAKMYPGAERIGVA